MRQMILDVKIRKLVLSTTGIVFLILALNPLSVLAETLENLRASGAIGEGYDGYVIPRISGAQADANEINAKRQAIYQEKAAAQGVSIDQVGKVYAAEIIRKVPAGTWIQINGQWKKKE